MSQNKKTYPRFNLWQRIEHGVLLFSFTMLAVTGLPQKFADTSWGTALIGVFGGIETTRLIHRSSAIILMVGAIYHLIVLAYRILVQRVRFTMLPGWQDVKDGFQAMAHNVGLVKQSPQMGRYTFGEKAEYWAVVWGTVIMVITGFMLWNPIATAWFLPGEFIPAAKAAHGAEAILAALSILTWHIYNVHLKHFNKSMFTGRISRHEMEEEHPLELADMEAGRVSPPPAAATLQRRQRIFLPVAAIITLTLLVGLYIFVTFERTAISTVPRQNIEIYVPATPGP
jgi:formate dehydrogenase gamma subunit